MRLLQINTPVKGGCTIALAIIIYNYSMQYMKFEPTISRKSFKA